MNGKGTEYIAEAVMERGRKMEKWKTPRPGKDREEKRRDEKRRDGEEMRRDEKRWRRDGD